MNAVISKNKTYDEWKKAGFYVRQGEKASMFINGVAVFTREQVEEKEIEVDYDDHYDKK